MRGTSGSKKDMTLKTLGAFVGITFVLSWGLLLVYLGVPELERISGPLGYTNPLYFLMVWAPAFAGLWLVGRHHGLRGLVSFARRMTMWRMPARWWAFFLLGLPAVFYVGAAIKGTFPAPFPFDPWYGVLPAIATTIMLGSVEEFGWSGVALPVLQRRFSPFVASLAVGVVWAVWHIPAFSFSTSMSGFSFGTWFLGVMAIRLVMTSMFNASRGSVLIAYLFHWMLMNPIFPDAQPWDSVILAIIGVVVVVANRKKMFTRGTGVTNVLMPGDEDALCADASSTAGIAGGTLSSGRVAAAHD